MPIRPEMKARYPADWPQISARILERDGHACKFCGVANHALGGRLPSGRFLPAEPIGERRLKTQWPAPGDHGWCAQGHRRHRLRIIRVVLTIAHLHDPSPENCADDNLAALCQRCHNIHDAPMRARNRSEAARRALPIDDLFGRGA